MRLLKITFYKLKMMLGDRMFFAAMIVIPLLITLMTGYALRYEKMNTIPVAFVDEDKSSYSITLMERISQKPGFRLEQTDRKEALSLLENGRVEQVFIIGAGFEERIRSGENKGLIDLIQSPSSYSAGFTAEVVAGEVIRFVTGHMAADWVEDQYVKLKKDRAAGLQEEVLARVDSYWEPKPLMTVRYFELDGKEWKAVERVSLPAASATSAGIITAFLMFFLLFGSGWLVEERTNGTIKRLASAPDALRVSFAGSVAAFLIAGAVQVLLFSLVVRLLFQVELFPGIWAYMVFLAYLLAVVSIGLFLSSILRTQAQLQAGAPVLALITGFAGGCFWNFVEMPEKVAQLSLLTPQGWALEGLNRLMLQPDQPQAILVPVMVLFAIALILLPLSYIIIKRQVTV